MPGRPVLFLVNPRSRRGRQRYPAARAALRELGLFTVEEPCDDTSALRHRVERHRGLVEAVVVGGGDGTLHALADALVGLDLPVGILPFGTANDVARTLGIPDDLEAACRVIAEGHARPIDLGEVNGLRFFNVAHVGLPVAVTRGLSGEAKGRLGALAYAAAAFRAAWRARPFDAEVRCDGRVWRVPTLQLSVGNGRHYGGGMTVAEDAAIDDGALDLYSVECDRPLSLLRLLPALRSGTHGRFREVRTCRGREIEILTSPSRPVTADGEIRSRTPARFRVLPRALRVFVPAPVAAAGTATAALAGPRRAAS